MERNDRTDREGRDAAGIGPYAREREHLVALSTLASWTVSDGEPDIRGWEVRTVSGRQLGTVADLLVDEKAGEVVLLDVDLPGSDRHTFVPIRVAQIDRAKRVVLMDSADLPDSGETRVVKVAGSDRRGGSDTGTVRYPLGDRAVEVVRPSVADDIAPMESRSAAMTESERRRSDRRRIERLSTDF
jgi:sporulation protein YlmC with PRC-barrel domain